MRYIRFRSIPGDRGPERGLFPPSIRAGGDTFAPRWADDHREEEYRRHDFEVRVNHLTVNVGVHRCSCGYPPSPRGGPALWETLKVATFAIPQSHSVDCNAERVRPGMCGNDTPIVPSASWRRSKTVTRNGRRASPRRRGTSRLTAGTSGVRCCASKTPVGISRLYLCAARRHTPEL